jgi:hypothetical protein
MNTTIPFPTRYLAVMGVALAVAVFLLVARPMLLGGDSDTAAPTTTPTSPTTPHSRPHSRPATPSHPKVVLLPGLPPKVANKLRHSKVIVVSLYQGSTKSDHAAVAAGQQGADRVGAGFLAVNVLDEASARAVQSFVGTQTTPTVVIVRRPGRIVSTLEGAASSDKDLVAQAARNAGARRR